MQDVCEGCAVNMYCRWAVCAITARHGNGENHKLVKWLLLDSLTEPQLPPFFVVYPFPFISFLRFSFLTTVPSSRSKKW